jgi:hypothetical protein
VNGHQDKPFQLVWTPVTARNYPGDSEPTDVCGAILWVLNAKVPISTQYLKFPERAAPGSTPTPALNNISFATDDFGVGAEVGTLSFRAMAPVVLVHGWNSGPWEWGPETPDPNGPCGARLLSSDHGRATINTLVSAYVPFDCSIAIIADVRSTKAWHESSCR